ncbi:MFS transporter [Cohnella algarum]|nr:MFS transporter [Cohnella algarum]
MGNPLAASTARRFPYLLLKLRFFYLATGLAGGLLNPYIGTIFKESGLGDSAVGLIMACSSVLIVAAQLFWGRLADRYRLTKPILLLSLAVPAALSLLYQAPSIPVMIAAYMTVVTFTAPQAPISDAYAVPAARAAGSSYGTIRCFQSIGNALGGYGAGLFVSTYAPSSLVVPFFLLSCVGIAAVCVLPKQGAVSVANRSLSGGISFLLKNREAALFLSACFLINQTLTAFNTYFVIVFQHAGGSSEWAGTALMIAAISNVPSMFLASAVIGRLGLEKTMMIGAMAYIARWAIQYLLPVPSVMVGVQVLQGLSFGLFYVAAVEYVARLVPAGMQATGQSAFSMVFVGMAGMAGNLLNGFLLEAGGPSLMNAACTISAACGAALLAVIVKGTGSKRSSRASESGEMQRDG